MVIYVCTSLPQTLDSSACAKKGGLAGDQNGLFPTDTASSPQIWPLPHRHGLFPTEIQAGECVGQERKVREQKKHETKG